MATTRIIPIHISRGKTAAQCLKARIDYILNPAKTAGGCFVSSYECAPQTAAQEFAFDKRTYRENTGRTQQHDVIAYHLRQSFAPGEITPEEANLLGYETAKRFLKGQHAFIVATHTDRAHIHNHIIWNSTALDCRRKFRDFKRSGEAVARLSDTICVENRLSIVPEPMGKGKHYGAWLGDRRECSQRETLRQAIDDALAKHPVDLAELLGLLHKAGFEIKRGKHIALRGAGESRFKRLDSLGEGYTEAALAAILAGEQEHIPRVKRTLPRTEQVSLLVDIQAKLRAGKGAGYERWAKKFNAKELAKTLNFLSEAGVADYTDLVQRTENATNRMNELRDGIRQMETRMAEIGTMETHIFNYLKTKDVHAAYRASGYSRKFAEAHQQELALHRAAKSAFDALGTKKIPSIKALKAEYAALAQQKKQAYQAYRQAREDTRTLLRVRANVETILNDEGKDVPAQTAHRTQDDDVTVNFQAGEIHGIIGNNGSGKTLLFKVIAGYLRPQHGEVLIDGVTLGKQQDFPSSMGMILETPGFIASEDAYTNLALLWSLRGKPDRAVIHDTLKKVGLANVGKKHVGKFSLGMRQRLGIAQAIMESPRLLILDEPFNGLDKQGVQDIRSLLFSLKRPDVTILISSHIPGDIDMLCDTVHEMEDGVLRTIK